MVREKISFRMTEECEKKLNHLLEMDAAMAEKQKRKPKDRSEIINDAVVTYWMAMQADEYNDSYMQRLEIVFERVFRKYMSGFSAH